jgi:two-component system sensor histidine kinase BaeS
VKIKLKFSIAFRLFTAVLLAIILVASVAIVMMREKLSTSFADYAVKIELDRLQEVSDALEKQYAMTHDWSFLPDNESEQKNWITQELKRINQNKKHLPDIANEAQVKPIIAAKIPAAIASVPGPPSAPANKIISKIIVVPNDESLPPLPPPPPQPPAPPSSAELPEPPTPATPDLKIQTKPLQTDAFVLPELYTRISVLDADKRYLAGLAIDDAPGAARPLHYQGRLIGYLQIRKSSIPSDAMSRVFLQEQADTIGIIIILAIVLSALAAMLLAFNFKRPIQKLVEGSRQLAEGRFATRLEETRSDELGELAHSFNQLADKLERAEESRKQWVADTSHELRTPISVLRAQIEAIQDGIRPASPENIALMHRQLLSLNKLIDELYALAKADVGALQYQMHPLNLWQLITEETQNFREKIDNAQLSLGLSPFSSEVVISSDADRLRQLFANLLENSCRYTEAGGRIHISAQVRGDRLVIHIADSAPAVPEESLSRLGERFYRTDTSRNRQQGGAGLGLALCARIIEAHAGKLGFSHSELGGLQVEIDFPIQT